MTDENKIREICAKDPERGFRMLVAEYQSSMYWHIRRMVVSHEDAQDVLQEAFIRIFRHLNDFRAESSLTTWIYRITTNECLRFLDRRHKEMISSEEVQADLINKLMASEYVDYEDAMQVKFQQAILTLPEKQRLVFNLRYYDELKYEDISRITGTKVETLKANYYLAKEKIKEYMLNN
ncbi:MAG: RNA polymerase sigma factor [Bacteroides sp.]|nr:RNA polymerase sigma factor [Bacteroides sp.]